MISERFLLQKNQTCNRILFFLGSGLVVLLSACGTTAVIPADAATADSSEAMSSLLTQQQIPQDAWPVLGMLQGTGETAFWLPFSAQLEVENIDQNPELPNGCEVTSAAIVLQYLGFDADKVDLAENYLPTYSPYWEADPNVEFMGNPADELAFYCLPGALVTAINDYLADQGGGYQAVDISGAPVEELYQWVAGGTPVLVWTTRAFSDPLYNYTFQLRNGSWPYSNSHCLVLTGYDTDTCYLADPMLEVSEVERELFEQRYQERGEYAVVIVPQ